MAFGKWGKGKREKANEHTNKNDTKTYVMSICMC